ncbi:MAG: DUF1570 domain-containing protein [Planctomycetota bacterium]|jgi:hypothetical protein
MNSDYDPIRLQPTCKSWLALLAAALVATAWLVPVGWASAQDAEPDAVTSATEPLPEGWPEPEDDTAPAATEPAVTKPVEDDGEEEAEPEAKLPEGSVFGLPPYESEHFIVYTLRPPQMARDVSVRLENMYDEYRRMMGKRFKKTDRKALAFIFSDRQRFIAAGGHQFMPGISLITQSPPGPRLMLMSHSNSAHVSFDHLLRHEGWHHLLALNVPVRKRFPAWLDEGMAEYLGYSVWTGDETITGMIRPEGYHSLRGYVTSRRILPLRKLVTITDSEWMRAVNSGEGWRNYMQSWSVVHFLMSADNGEHRRTLGAYMEALCKGRDPEPALDGIIAVNSRYQRWVKSIPTSTTHPRFYRVMTAMLTSHLARAHAQGQRFTSAERFLSTARRRQLKMPPMDEEQWLPPSLLDELLWYIDQFTGVYGPFEIILEQPEGQLPTVRVRYNLLKIDYRGSFTLDGKKVADVSVEALEPELPYWPESLVRRAKARAGR